MLGILGNSKYYYSTTLLLFIWINWNLEWEWHAQDKAARMWPLLVLSWDDYRILFAWEGPIHSCGIDIINSISLTPKIAPVGTINHMVTLPKSVQFPGIFSTPGKDTVVDIPQESHQPNIEQPTCSTAKSSVLIHFKWEFKSDFLN